MGPIQTWYPYPGTKMFINVHDQLGKGIYYGEIPSKFGVGVKLVKK